MFIVFEGPDGSGKSTLCEAVQKKLNATRVHCGPPEPGKAIEQWNAVIDMASSNYNVVCDRLHWGDPVYAPIYRANVGEQLGSLGLARMNKRIADAGGVIILVTADPDVLNDRFDGEYIDPEDLVELVDTYETVAAMSVQVPIFRLDTSAGFDDFDYWVDQIIEFAADIAEYES